MYGDTPIMQIIPEMNPKACVIHIITGRLGELILPHQGFRKKMTGTIDVPIIIPK